MADESLPAKRLSNLVRRLYPPVPGHPIQTALRKLLCKKWEAFLYSCESLPREAESFGLGRYYREAFGRQFGELLEWVVGTPFEPSDLMKRCYSQAQKMGLGDQMMWMRPLLADLGYGDLASVRKRRGHPVERRQEAIQALELRLADPGRWTWGKLARHFCNCDETERKNDDHNRKCKERLRREVGHLKRFLEKSQIPLPE